jgi:hypothetical protein
VFASSSQILLLSSQSQQEHASKMQVDPELQLQDSNYIIFLNFSNQEQACMPNALVFCQVDFCFRQHHFAKLPKCTLPKLTF